MNGVLILACLLGVILAGDGGLVLLHRWVERTSNGRAVEPLPRGSAWVARLRLGLRGVGGSVDQQQRVRRHPHLKQPNRRDAGCTPRAGSASNPAGRS